MATPKESRPSSSSFDLADDSARDNLLEQQAFEHPSTKERKWRSWLRPVFGHLILMLIYSVVFLKAWTTVSSSHIASNPRDLLSYSPALEAIEYKKQLIDSTEYTKSPYSGNPSREVDLAWIGLMDGFNLRVSGETLGKINRTSIPLADGSGDYIAGLDTTHHLHCLLSIRHALAPDYYAGEVSRLHKAEGETYPTHISHCIEILRKMLLCKASGSLYTYAWSETQHEPLTNFAVEHTCVDWERLQDWTRKHTFDIRDDLLVHPIYGKWPNGGPL